MIKNCQYCNKELNKKSTESKKYFSVKKFCSHECYGMFGFSLKHKEKLRQAKLGKPLLRSEAGKALFTEKMAGAKNPRFTRVILICKECESYFQVRNYRKDEAQFCSRLCATNNNNQGKTPENMRIRKSGAYKAWRTLVFERDNYTCVGCNDHNFEGRGSTLMLHADHIKPFALFPELRLDVNNGRTLCVPCHKKTGTYGRKSMYRENDLLAVLNNI